MLIEHPFPPHVFYSCSVQEMLRFTRKCCGIPVQVPPLVSNFKRTCRRCSWLAQVSRGSKGSKGKKGNKGCSPLSSSVCRCVLTRNSDKHLEMYVFLFGEIMISTKVTLWIHHFVFFSYPELPNGEFFRESDLNPALWMICTYSDVHWHTYKYNHMTDYNAFQSWTNKMSQQSSSFRPHPKWTAHLADREIQFAPTKMVKHNLTIGT